MTTAMTDYTRRPKRAWQADGLSDMAIGGAVLLGALIFLDAIYMLMFTQTQRGATPEYMYVSRFNMLVTSVIQVLVAVPFLLVEPLKRRYVYPRSGYMHLRVDPKERRVSLAIVTAIGIASVGYAWMFIRATAAQAPDPTGLSGFWTTGMSVIAVGTGFGIALVVNYLKFGFVRHVVVAATTVTAAAVLATTRLDWEHQFLILSVVAGAGMVIAGAIPFARLLRTPLAAEPLEQEAE